jgi:hypothetical protein
MASDQVNLEALKQEVELLGDKVNELKTASPVDKDAIGASVAQLLAAKQKYADNNNGIGVDGEPYEAPMSKAEKKAKAKAEKKAAAAAGPAKQQVRRFIYVLQCLMHVWYLKPHTFLPNHSETGSKLCQC